MKDTSAPPVTTAQLSVITTLKPARISKLFRVRDGKIERANGGLMERGKVEVVSVDGLDGLAMILGRLTPTTALAYGVPADGAASRILTRKQFERRGKPKGSTTRTRDAFKWPEGPGAMMLDYDPPASAAALSRDQLVDAIRAAVPRLSDARMLWWSSASSNIWLDDREVSGVRGQRLWLLTSDASDIARAGATLVSRLWLGGHGRFDISASGALLERTLIDASVWQPERLDFAGGAVCQDGIEQRRGVPIHIPGAVEAIDSRTALPDLTAAEKTTLDAMRRDARAAVAGEAETKREAWIDERVAEIGGDEPRGTAIRALDYGTLGADFLIEVEVDGKFEKIAVAAILDDRERWNLARTRDPIEPGYDGGRVTGKLFLLQLRPQLFSFAHGGRSYALTRTMRTIEVAAGFLREAVDETIDVLRADPLTFDFGDALVTVDDGRIRTLDQNSAAYHLGGLVSYTSPSGPERPARPVDIPKLLPRQLLSIGNTRRLRQLMAVATAPTIRLDGSVLCRAGFDEDTGLLLDLPLADAPDVPESPTKAEARAALDTLMYPFNGFPFVDARARAALLSALLTAAVRPILPTAPAHGFDAPTVGSGKTLLARCIGVLVEGYDPRIIPLADDRDDAEMRKRLNTLALDGERLGLIDNLIGTLDSASLAAFLTAPRWGDRILGGNTSFSLPNKVMVLLTGNNLSFAGDMPRRVLICRIDPEMEAPITRQFDLEPVAHCIDHRLEMLAAACTLIRARFTRPISQAPGAVASFEDWDRLVRQTVVWAATVLDYDAEDPMTAFLAAMEADPKAAALATLYAVLFENFGSTKFFTAADVAKAAKRGDGYFDPDAKLGDAGATLREALEGVYGRANEEFTSVRVGRMLEYRKGKIAGGLRLEMHRDAHRRVNTFRIGPIS